ncbi:MAG: hypothetical protein JO236_09615 [Mycobacterium sp.]|uniref:hypothetical protein n=1 Tax=Mycobacterium sp. TaxID=1785 RepID=UPI001EC89F77|nr:hypothetical protein [Mycobacterium sp.]MBW0017785.1 hypothetical protein [Mycobacterium sp.]
MRIVNQTVNPPQARAVRLGFGALAFTAVTVATYVIARYRAFTGFASYDDEGCLLISLKAYLNHGSLYDDVPGGYGPFYFEFWDGIFSIFGIAVDHDGSRAVTGVIWVLSSLLFGLSVWRMTTSITLGLATQLMIFGPRLVEEPMSAGGTAVLFVSLLVTVSCFVRDRSSRVSIALLGGVLSALILIKINVGIFAFAAVALVCVVSYPTLARRRWLRPLVEFGVVALPALVMVTKASEDWARHYAVHVAASALTVVIALRARGAGRRDSNELWWLGGGLLIVAATIFLAILASGTSPSGLITGVFVQPLRFPSSFSRPLHLLIGTYVLDLMALAGALAYWYVVRKHDTRPRSARVLLVSSLSILIGLYMAFSVIERKTLSTPLGLLCSTLGMNCSPLEMLCFAWVALIQIPGKPIVGTQFARLLLAPLAVLQGLHGFPVAGSQINWSAMLLIPVGALCIANGVRGLALSVSGQTVRRTLFAIGAIAAAAIMVLLVNTQLVLGLQRARSVHDAWVPLGLPGADDVRVSPGDAAKYRAVVAAIDQNCKTFIMLPEMHSFYFWTQQEPPTGYEATGWTSQFDQVHQRRVIEATRSIDGLCLLENSQLAQFWGLDEMPPGPMDRYVQRGFVPIATFGDYQLLKRAGIDGGS